ncbi:MAG: S8 family serine peptidase [Bacteriovoracaceae bacterium]|nr:S8 family serine peptidase [Bacteriovoracaceae bacterium]
MQKILGIMVSLLFVVSAQAKFSKLAAHKEGEVLVKLKPQHTLSWMSQKQFSHMSVKQKLKLGFGDFVLLKVDEKNLLTTLQDLSQLGEIEYAEPNYIYQPIMESESLLQKISRLTTDDPSFDKLWGLHNTGTNEPDRNGGYTPIVGVAGADINALKAWEITRGSRKVKIAVIDTGVDLKHPDLIQNLWLNQAEAEGEAGVDDDGNGFIDDIHGYDFANKDGDPQDDHGHGTHCSGTIAATHNNNEGVAGVMAEATIVAVKFLGTQGGTTVDAISSVDYATSLDVDIMSNSWGGGGESQALKEAIQKAAEKNILFVAAAGNSSSNNDVTPHYPSNYEVNNVISVAAMNSAEELAYFSCYGRNTVHVAAPGHNILSTVLDANYAIYSGTSMATPHVSGVLGLLVANEGRSDVTAVRERLMATTNEASLFRRKVASGGRVDAYNLLTNTRPPRTPEPTHWQRIDLDEVIESDHPYLDNSTLERTIHIPDAKHIRFVINKIDTESGYDKISVKNAKGVEMGSVTGLHENIRSEYVDGDTISLSFKADHSINGWGFLIDAVEVSY